MAARLMNGLRSALQRGWQQGCDVLHPAPRPTLLEALRDTYLAAAHTVTQVTQDAERMAYPQFRARLLRMAAEDQGHVTWLRDTSSPAAALSRPARAPRRWHPRVGPRCAGRWPRRAYEALLEPMHLAEQADPELAAGFCRLRAATQQYREALLEILVKSDSCTVARDPTEALSLPLSPSALR